MSQTSDTNSLQIKSAPEKERSPLQYMKGIGPKRAEALAASGILTAHDLLRCYPRAYIDRNTVPSLAELRHALITAQQQDIFSENNIRLQSEMTVVVYIRQIRERMYGKNRTMVVLELDDHSGARAEIVFWNQAHYFKKIYEPDQLLVISGIPVYEYGKIQFHHPEIDKIDPDDIELFRNGHILPKYRLTQKMKDSGLTMRVMRNLIFSVLEAELPKVEETLPDNLLQTLQFPDKQTATRCIHFPDSPEALENARNRMKFEELFFFELLLAMRRRGIKTLEVAPAISAINPRARTLLKSLPFELTKAQKRVLREIALDIRNAEFPDSPTTKPMNRLLQGDVGSGKTIVALLSMLMAIDSGYQCALMAPTEILAEQHFKTLQTYLVGSDVTIVQLVGGQKNRARREVMEQIRSGSAHIVVGTHALFQSAVQYHRLGFVVIDEQHRFGVLQRAELKKKAAESFVQSGDNAHRQFAPHIMVMSATPIPRTLSLTLYGDLDVSIIDELPKNRKPIITKVVFESKLPSIFEFIRKQITQGFQAYIVYPLVEKSEKVEAKSAIEHYEFLQHEVFPDLKVGLLHGQMFWYEKEDTMKAFKNREYDILVATTVVEVGIDIPNATVMLIENAERFGLAQLHQLRGRVGRGAEQSYCLLATKDHFQFHLGKREQEAGDRKSCIIRLKTMQESTDGFYIAEVDLQIRGPGDFLGTRQSGVPEFSFADLTTDAAMIALAREHAFRIVEHDPHLRYPEHQTIRREFLRQHRHETSFVDIA